MAKKKKKTHYELVRSKGYLWQAWQTIRSNGMASSSRTTRREIRAFDEVAAQEINKITGELSSKKSFRFSKSVGVPQRKKKGGLRPIVISSVRNRVVQRAILDVIQDDASLQDLFDSATSYGGIKGKGVKNAVLRAYDEVKSGRASFFITSDISGFFKDIKRSVVENEVNKKISDRQFQDLFKRAIETELSNIESLRNKGNYEIFPIEGIGVAQGCSLSPLVGNIYLREFDAKMNGMGVLCLRYIDDFIILGPDESKVRTAFNAGIWVLKGLGLSAYLPEKDSEKAAAGPVSKGFDYLGCTITPTSVRPSKKSWGALYSEIRSSFRLALEAIDAPKTQFLDNRLDFSSIVQLNSRRVESWVKQYEFTDDSRVISQWAHALQEAFHEFEVNYQKLLRGEAMEERCRLLGWPDMGLIFSTGKSKTD